MERYDYRSAVKADALEALKELVANNGGHYDPTELHDDLWIDDSVTGNASGSYYCNTWKAEEAIAHNLDLLAEALEEFGCSDVSVLEKGAEYCDVTIRCYLLGEVIGEILEGIENGEYDDLRICSQCGAVMSEGFCIGDGEEYYCTEECRNARYTLAEWEVIYDSGNGYWTTWHE